MQSATGKCKARQQAAGATEHCLHWSWTLKKAGTGELTKIYFKITCEHSRILGQYPRFVALCISLSRFAFHELCMWGQQTYPRGSGAEGGGTSSTNRGRNTLGGGGAWGYVCGCGAQGTLRQRQHQGGGGGVIVVVTVAGQV